MSRLFVIEDELHAEQQGEYATLAEAQAELERRATLPWDREPNRCPRTSWRTCARRYQIIEQDDSSRRWRQLSRTPYLEVSAEGAKWLDEQTWTTVALVGGRTPHCVATQRFSALAPSDHQGLRCFA